MAVQRSRSALGQSGRLRFSDTLQVALDCFKFKKIGQRRRDEIKVDTERSGFSFLFVVNSRITIAIYDTSRLDMGRGGKQYVAAHALESGFVQSFERTVRIVRPENPVGIFVMGIESQFIADLSNDYDKRGQSECQARYAERYGQLVLLVVAQEVLTHNLFRFN